jgi:hypothetical protein
MEREIRASKRGSSGKSGKSGDDPTPTEKGTSQSQKLDITFLLWVKFEPDLPELPDHPRLLGPIALPMWATAPCFELTGSLGTVRSVSGQVVGDAPMNFAKWSRCSHLDQPSRQLAAER